MLQKLVPDFRDNPGFHGCLPPTVAFRQIDVHLQLRGDGSSNKCSYIFSSFQRAKHQRYFLNFLGSQNREALLFQMSNRQDLNKEHMKKLKKDGFCLATNAMKYFNPLWVLSQTRFVGEDTWLSLQLLFNVYVIN